MAESVVSFVLNNLKSLLEEEYKLLTSVEQEVNEIISELEIIKSFLKDADARAAAAEEEEEGKGNEGVKTWVKQVREQAYRIEDVIDEYILNLSHLPDCSGSLGFLQKVPRYIKKLKLRHQVATEIGSVKSSLDNINRAALKYNFGHRDEESIIRKRNTNDFGVGSLFIEETEVVGIESTKQRLIDWLLNDRLERSVIAVVGEGGLGKTTIAGKVFNNEVVKNRFDCQAWISVGKEYNKRELLSKIIKKFYRLAEQSAPAEISSMDERELITTLREHLQDKSYMILFDDVWKTEFWRDVEYALLENNRSSRIMITTRHMDVANFCKHSAMVEVYELTTLPPKEAWKLFCRKAFGPSSDGTCPPELAGLSREILAKCGGLPLAIVAVGGLLSTKEKVVSEWQRVLNSLGSKLGSDPHLKDCNRVLSEGYSNLPDHLKSCLLYFGLFPESHIIKCSRLIRLWIAEGFVATEQDAEEYLNELIDRSLVQVSERYISGRARRCRVHDLMYEIIIRKSKELGFFGALDEGKSDDDCSKTRRISIHGSTDGFLQRIKDSKARTVVLFNVDKPPETFMSTVVSHFKLMKVLDLEDAPIYYLPEGLGSLFHLRYLSAKNTKVETIPKSIGKLLNLEVLDLMHSLVSELPVEIRNLKKLRYLMVFHYKGGAIIQGGFGSLTYLQKLYYVQANSEILKELRKLKNMRKLGIRLENGNGEDLCSSIAELKKLESLKVDWTSGDKIVDIDSLDSPPPNLQHLFLAGNMKRLPYWIFVLKNLIRVSLESSGLTSDPMSDIQTLPNLLELRLVDTYNYLRLHFEEGWFPKLQILSLLDLKAVKSMVIEEGAMPNLRELKIGPCPRLREIPAGIEHLRNLKFLNFRDMLREVYHMTQDRKWNKVTEHIPEIRVSFKKAEKYYYCTAKYLSSLSHEDFQEFTEELDQRTE
ncbi:Disease resistance protein [Melia azedarach]|uniref:Disease resistance protein n=1 Tax=Melia azedarach TaxID=155640 RepID=A0ACC1YNK6_MELAZ|nr:Disease resistance protein [Melia azedarach]